MKPLRFSRHAKRTLVFWGIKLEDVQATLSTPDRVLPTEKSRLNAIKQLGNHFLRVSYKEEADHFLVVTVTPRKKPW
ncbi:MAG: DUF4258 domain-containing protein [Chloroflexi bacterium]|nr:DUF4258 domain-containing protein [Chloroflexota bacterium]